MAGRHDGAVAAPDTNPADAKDLVAHWDAAYADGERAVSRTEDLPVLSLRFVTAATAGDLRAPVVDVGGGASRLVDELDAAGHEDLTVVDLSDSALALARTRMGERAARVCWEATDITTWRPSRRYAVWHDRAVLHFLRDPDLRAAYGRTVANTVRPGGHAIIASFAPDGPERCSGLPVHRADISDLEALLGPSFETVTAQRAVHHTPRGTPQAFAWLSTRRV